jgi:hypothetical protein
MKNAQPYSLSRLEIPEAPLFSGVGTKVQNTGHAFSNFVVHGENGTQIPLYRQLQGYGQSF